MATKKDVVRVLCLHGWRSCQKVMDFQIRLFKESMKRCSRKQCHFEVVNATFPASGPSHAELLEFFGDIPYFEWWDAQNAENSKEPIIYKGIEDSIKRVDYIVQRHGPFDVVLGFSQGSTFTSILNAHYTTQAQPIPWKVCVHISGMVSRDPVLHAQLEKMRPLRLPAVFVLGQQDYLYSYAKELIPYYDQETCHVYEFEGGHRFPYKHEIEYDAIVRQVLAFCT